MHARNILPLLFIAASLALLPVRASLLSGWGKASQPPAPPLVGRASALISLPPERLPGLFRGQTIRERPVFLREKVIALTFDDGPNPDITPDILDLLRRYHAPATFFIVGKYGRQWPELLAREAREGHAVESHSDSHPGEEVSPAHAAGELDRAQAAIARWAGRPGTLFRPPWGRTDNNMTRLAMQRGQCVVKWTLCSSDNPRLTAADIVSAVTKNPHSGDIVLLHDGRDRRQTVRALPEILRRLSAAGYRFVTVPELLHRWDEALSRQGRRPVRLSHQPHRAGRSG